MTIEKFRKKQENIKISSKYINKRIHIYFVNLIPAIVSVLLAIYFVFFATKSITLIIASLVLLFLNIYYLYLFFILINNKVIYQKNLRIEIEKIEKIQIKKAIVLGKYEIVLSIVENKKEYIFRIKGMLFKHKFIALLSKLSNKEVKYENWVVHSI